MLVSVRKEVEKKSEYFFPDEIVINILCRLPAKDVLHCRCVCRSWRDLTSNPDLNFMELHLKFCVPMIFAVNSRVTRRTDVFFLDKWWETGRNRPVIHNFGRNYGILFSDIEEVASPQDKSVSDYGILFSDSDLEDAFSSPQNTPVSDYRILFSLNGLIVWGTNYIYRECTKNFKILNPLNGENIRINLSKQFRSTDLNAVFFHPLLEEYCTLWTIRPYGSCDLDNSIEYRVLNLGSNPCWKKIRRPSGKTNTLLSINPVFIDNYLYWVVYDRQDDEDYDDHTLHLHIMEYDIINEEFKMISCPVPEVLVEDCHLNILNIDGCLSFVQIIGDSINIWTLKDCLKQSWECSGYKIKHDLDIFHVKKNGILKAICVENEELAIQSNRTLFIYNLKSGTIRIMDISHVSRSSKFSTHLMCFASLKNCKSVIYMCEKGELDMEDETIVIWPDRERRARARNSNSIDFPFE